LETYHNFGSGHQPTYWPRKYYVAGHLLCPPKVERKEERFFYGMEGIVYKFRGLDFTYIGKHPTAAAKAHWQPHPFSPRFAKGKGKQKGKPEGKGQETHESDKEAGKQLDRDPGSRANDWFT
jgi:hypothetical protein